jgi:hypothetical protein
MEPIVSHVAHTYVAHTYVTHQEASSLRMAQLCPSGSLLVILEMLNLTI